LPDIVSPEVRSRMMAGIRSKNTKPEMIVRKGLHRLGLRYRLHDKKLPGKPDLVFPKYRAVLFVHGCFWHGHDCPAFKWPQSNVEFWREKINANRERDRCDQERLSLAGLRCITAWECQFKLKQKTAIDAALIRLANDIQFI
jgi:DNA mismatch endonuclease, patch repair protein